MAKYGTYFLYLLFIDSLYMLLLLLLLLAAQDKAQSSPPPSLRASLSTPTAVPLRPPLCGPGVLTLTRDYPEGVAGLVS